MKLIISILALSFTTTVLADEYVNGYVRKDGTYVEPHYRSSPDSNKYNNYSTQGNTNPYNGKSGNVDPYAIKSYESPQTIRNNYNNPYGR